jgi:hypothetical protein
MTSQSVTKDWHMSIAVIEGIVLISSTYWQNKEIAYEIFI